MERRTKWQTPSKLVKGTRRERSLCAVFSQYSSCQSSKRLYKDLIDDAKFAMNMEDKSKDLGIQADSESTSFCASALELLDLPVDKAVRPRRRVSQLFHSAWLSRKLMGTAMLCKGSSSSMSKDTQLSQVVWHCRPALPRVVE